ncbi:siderophore-interacting protein [Streptomyces sp. NPDC048606]|uniref:siderophore-interacting protein n=1 Tax=Streptomyces sp. NPDC048606 TaxID=3154726 RepID=UPI003420598E
MPETETRPRRSTVHTGRVLRTERVTPHMIRVELGGDGLHAFEAGRYTDHYVKLLFPPAHVHYVDPTDLAAIRRDLPRAQWPRMRTYTVRDWDPEAGRLTIDFVVHGPTGLAGPWAAAARPGDTLHFLGPGGGYAPSPEADWHLLAGDESALPAIAAALAHMPADATVRTFVEVAGPGEEQPLPTTTPVTWLHRGPRPVGDALTEAVTTAAFPPGTPQVFLHGEAHFVRTLRRHLATTHPEAPTPSISGYWRRGADEDTWQATKSAW